MITVQLTSHFEEWLDRLDDKRARIRSVARLRQAESGNLGDWKSLEGDLSEMRIHFGPGYRPYFTRRGYVLIVVLAGGVKSTQSRDIRRAKTILKDLESEL